MAQAMVRRDLALPGPDWATTLATMAHEARMPFADAALAAMETAWVADSQTRVAQWWRAWMPWALASLGVVWTRATLAQWEARTAFPPDWSLGTATAWDHAWTSGWMAAERVQTPRAGTAPRPAPAPSPEPPGGSQPPRRPAPIIDLTRYRQTKEAAWLAEHAAALHLRGWALGMQTAVRALVVQAVQERWTAAQLTAALADRWRLSGVDFRRIAVTELNAAYSGGLLLALPAHSSVWIPPIGDGQVCAACRHVLEGRVFRVLHAPPIPPTKADRETALWPTKSNRGIRDRAAWDPCVPLHPFCRHLPVPVGQQGANRAPERTR